MVDGVDQIIWEKEKQGEQEIGHDQAKDLEQIHIGLSQMMHMNGKMAQEEVPNQFEGQEVSQQPEKEV